MGSDKTIPKIPLPSIDELVMLVYKESGYKMQISGEDPLLSVVYLNQAVLGATLLFAKKQFAEENRVHLNRIEQNYQRVIGELLNRRGEEKRPASYPDRWRESPEQRTRRSADELAQQQQRAADAILTAETTVNRLEPTITPMAEGLKSLGKWVVHTDDRVTKLAKKLYLVVGVSIVASTCIGVLIGKLL